MAVQIAPPYTNRQYFWTDWKAMWTSKGGVPQYDDDGTIYEIWFYDGPEVHVCTIWKGSVPSSILSSYTQVQNDADKSDFETNYKAGFNKRISRTDNWGNPIGDPVEFAAAFGLLPGVTVDRATGYVATSGTGGVAVRATAYSPQGANAQRSIKSSSANDTSAGSGARTVKITYLTAAFVLKTETVTLNGTTAVNTVGVDIAYIEKMEVMTVGTQGGGNAGTISLYTQTNGGGSVWGSIATGDNMTYWAHHYVPSGKTCYILNVSGGATSVSGGITVNRSGDPSGATQPQKGVGGTYVHGGPGNTDHTFRIPMAIPGPDLVWLVERPTATQGSTAYGTFEYMEY